MERIRAVMHARCGSSVIIAFNEFDYNGHARPRGQQDLKNIFAVSSLALIPLTLIDVMKLI